MSVEFAGIYSKDTNQILTGVTTLGGLGTTIAPVFLKKSAAAAAAGISSFCGILGIGITIYGAITVYLDLIDPLEDKDYYSYKVTMEWSETKPVNPESTIYTKTNYASVTYLVWNDARIGHETWTSIGYSCNFTTETIEIPIG